MREPAPETIKPTGSGSAVTETTAAAAPLAELKKPTAKAPPAWWRSLPSWYNSVDEVKAAAEKEKQETAKAVANDWWVGTNYKGKSYATSTTATTTATKK